MELERLGYEVKLLKGKPDTGPLGNKIQHVKNQLDKISTERAANVLLPPGELIDAVVSAFDLDELNQLAFDMGMNHEDLQGNKWQRVHKLVSDVQRRRLMSGFVLLLKEERPSIDWPDVE